MKSYTDELVTYAHLKYDGHFLEISKNHVGTVLCITRGGTDVTPMLAHQAQLLGVWKKVPYETTLHAELWVPGQPASAVKTALKAGTGYRVSIHAVATMPDETPLEQIAELCEMWGLDFIPYYTCLDNPRSLAGCIGSFEDMPSKPAYEGYVFKDGNRLNMLKYKPMKTIDLIVHDTEPWIRDFKLAGSLICKTSEGHIVANAMGIPDHMRTMRFVGRVIEVSYQSVGSKGRLRHPVFMRLRDDKRADECGVDQDQELERYYESRPS